MARRRDHAAEHRRRDELARKRGFASFFQQRKAKRDVRSRADLEALPTAAREARTAALSAVSYLRHEPGLSLDDAARRAGTSPEVVRWYAPEALERRGNRTIARQADRLYRSMYVFSGGQRVPIDVRGSRAASQVGAYHQAVKHYLSTGDDRGLQRFHGKRVGGVEFETDLDEFDPT